MAGISHVLSIAKEALLTHQLSVQVAAHNIANVDTPGYTRQTLSLKAHQATPTGVGLLGGGVSGDTIGRNYDQFMVQRLVGHQSLMGSLDAQQQAMRLVESVFNEAPGLAVNDLMNKFWASWQDLADNPEIAATRQSTLQTANLVIDQLKTMSAEMARSKYDIGVSLDTAIKDVNSITRQIADLNVQISTAETGAYKANDLRDRRDNLVKNLSELVNISFFEDKSGAYSVLLADGHTLVAGNQSWQMDWENNQLIWVNQDASGRVTRKPIGSGAELGGKIGGWLEVRGHLVEGDPDNFQGRLDAFANALIREINQQHSQGAGLVRFGSTLTGAEQAKNTSVLWAAIDPATATARIEAGAIIINGRPVGEISGGTAVYGLATTKAFNAATAINLAETGVTARLTTQVAGGAVDAGALNAGDPVSLTVNGFAINYTVQAADAGNDAAFAANMTTAINSAIAAHNSLTTTTNPITITAVVGDGSNGGIADSLVFRNTNPGDESAITLGSASDPALGLAAIAGASYRADIGRNTGEITLFATSDYTIRAGVTDSILQQLGLANVAADLQKGDGVLTYGPTIDDHKGPLLQGYSYAEQLSTDNGSFEIWIYNSDSTLALPQPVTVSLERAYSLNDVIHAINTAMTNAGAKNGTTPWVEASNANNSLRLTPAAGYEFAFANDTSNFLQVAGLNTFFTGSSAASIGINDVIAADLNKIAAGSVGRNGEIFRGDNSNALKIIGVQYAEYVSFKGGASSSLAGFYNSLVGEVANQTRTVNRGYEYNILVNNQLHEMRDAVSGVSLDEEMANLVKFQQAYTAAARLITMSDEMLTTLLNTVR